MDHDILAERAGLPQPLAGREIERAHLVIGMGENNTVRIWRRYAIPVPALDQIGPRLLGRPGGVGMTLFIIGANGLVGAAGR